MREWLQAETIAGLLVADDDDLSRARFVAAPGVREALVDETDPAYLGGLALAVPAAFSVMPELLAAFRTGAGVPYASYGEDAVDGAGGPEPTRLRQPTRLRVDPADPRCRRRCSSDRGCAARVADVGCGLGWAAIELAKAYPHIGVDGYDSDEESITRARRNAADVGVSDRVNFNVVDASERVRQGRYDLVVFFECVHDMAHPVTAMRAGEGRARRRRDRDRHGRTRQQRRPLRATRSETFFATASVLWCLPQGRVEPDSEAVGTLMSASRLPDRAGRRLVRHRDPADRPSILEVLPAPRLGAPEPRQ